MPLFKNIQASSLRLTLSLGVAQTLAWASSYYIPAVMAPAIAGGTGCAPSLVYAAFSMAMIIAALAAPFAGRRIDRFGGKKVLVASNLLFTLGLVLLSQAHGPVSLFLAWAVLGVAMGAGLYDMAFATVVRSYGAAASSIIAGITLIAGFASTVGWPVSHFLLENLGWRFALLIWAGVHIVLALPLNLSLRLPDNTGRLGEKRREAGTGNGQIRPMLFLGGAFVFIAFCSGTVASHLPGLLQLFGVSVTISVLAGMGMGPSQVFARILQLSLMRSLRPANTAILAVLIIPIGAIALSLFGSGAGLLMGISHGFGNGIMTIIKGTLPLSVFGETGYGRRQGLLFLPAGIVQALSPFLFSLCITGLGRGALYVYITAACCALVLFLALKRQTRR